MLNTSLWGKPSWL